MITITLKDGTKGDLISYSPNGVFPLNIETTCGMYLSGLVTASYLTVYECELEAAEAERVRAAVELEPYRRGGEA